MTKQSLQKSNSNKKEAILLTIIASSLWGTSFPAIKIGLQFMDAYTFVFLRFFFAALILLFIGLSSKKLRFDFNKRLVIFLGCINGIAYILQYIGMSFTSASKSSLLVNLTVVWVALLNPLLRKEQIAKKQISGVVLSLLGIIFVTTNLDFQSFGNGTMLGDLVVLASGIIWAIFIIYNKPLVNESKNLMIPLAWLVFFTLIPLIPLILFSAKNFFILPVEAWIVVLYTSIFCWIIPYYTWSKGLKKISPVSSSIILLNEILVSVIISTVLLDELLTVLTGVGAVLILIAILLVSMR
jgi:drug/metabolite transporter (DMT)-like permease